jgi:hypothetical protein
MMNPERPAPTPPTDPPSTPPTDPPSTPPTDSELLEDFPETGGIFGEPDLESM